MRESARTYIIGAGFLLVFFVAAAFAQITAYSRSQLDDRPRAHQQEYTEAKARIACAAYEAPAARLDCISKMEALEEDRQIMRADLKAQQDMAVWALSMFWVSAISILVSGAGIILIYETLKASHAGLSQMDETLTQARSTAEAAWATVDLQKQELRPYALIELVGHNFWDALSGPPQHGEFTWQFLFRNFGKAPCEIIEISAGIVVSKSPPDLDGNVASEDELLPMGGRHMEYESLEGSIISSGGASPNIKRGAGFFFDNQNELNEAETAEFARRHVQIVGPFYAIYLIGWIKYKGVLSEGNAYRTRFCYKLEGAFERVSQYGGAEYNERT